MYCATSLMSGIYVRVALEYNTRHASMLESQGECQAPNPASYDRNRSLAADYTFSAIIFPRNVDQTAAHTMRTREASIRLKSVAWV